MKKVYINDLEMAELAEMFEMAQSGELEFKFKHKDNCLIFTTDGYFIFAKDIDNPDEDVFSDYNFYEVLKSHYIDLNEFIYDFKQLEELLGYELHVADRCTNADVSIRQIEIWHKRDEKDN